MSAHAMQEYPREACGVYYRERGGAYRCHGIPNRAPASQAGRSFFLDPLALLDILERQDRGEISLLAFYHSHPDGEAKLSKKDLLGLVYEGKYLYPKVDVILLSLRPPTPPSFAVYRQKVS